MLTCLLIVAGYLLSILPIDPNTDQHYTTSIPNALAMEYIRMLHMHEYEVHVCTYLSSMKWSTTVYPMMYYSVAWWSIGWGMPASLSRPYLIILLCLGRKFTPSYVMRNTARAHEAPVRGGIYIRTYRQAHWLHWHVPAYGMSQHMHQMIKDIHITKSIVYSWYYVIGVWFFFVHVKLYVNNNGYSYLHINNYYTITCILYLWVVEMDIWTTTATCISWGKAKNYVYLHVYVLMIIHVGMDVIIPRVKENTIIINKFLLN